MATTTENNANSAEGFYQGCRKENLWKPRGTCIVT